MTNEELVRGIQAGDHENEYVLRLWEQNKGLVNVLVRKYGSRLEYEDLFQEAFLGLYTAAAKYDPAYNTSFCTYACYWIKLYILRYMQNKVPLVRIPANVRETIIRYKRVTDEFEKDHARKPTEEEVIDAIRINSKTFDRIQKAEIQFNFLSLSETVSDESDTSWECLIPSDTDVENEVLLDLDRKKMQTLLWTIIEQLPEKYSKIIKMRFRDGMSLKEIGDRIGVSERQISQIESNVRRKIRMSPSSTGLREYYTQYLQ